MPAGRLDEARGRIDLARRADRHEEVAARERGIDRIERQRHLAEPHHVRAQDVRFAAGLAAVIGLEVVTAGVQRRAGGAARPQQLAMHVDEVARPGALVQVVDVLGHHQHLARPVLLEAGERFVRGVRLNAGAEQLAAALVVEALHGGRLAGKSLGRRDLLEPPALPQAVGAAKARQAGFDRDAGAGQHDDRAAGGNLGRLVHAGRPRQPLAQVATSSVSTASMLSAAAISAWV